MKSILLALPVALSATVALADSHYVNGTVTKVDTQWNRVMIDHEALEALSMPAMTMVFELADPAMIEGLSEGQDIAFVADRVQGKLTVTEIREQVTDGQTASEWLTGREPIALACELQDWRRCTRDLADDPLSSRPVWMQVVDHDGMPVPAGLLPAQVGVIGRQLIME